MTLLPNLLSNFFTVGQTLFYYYYIALFSILFVLLAVESRAIYSHLKKLGRRYALLLLAVVVVFFAVDVLFVPATQQLFNDEFIYQSIAKTILFDHIVGICSFSSATHCVANTAGLFHEPGGWPFLLAIAFGAFGISFGTAFNLTLLLSLISIVLVAYVAFFLVGDKRVAVLSGLIMAFTPLFMTFSRATLSDFPAMTFGLLSILFLLLYLRERSLRFGILTLFSIAVTLSMKVDAVIILPILLAILLFNKETFKSRWKRIELYKLVAIIVLLLVVLIPEIMFLAYAPSQGFGNPNGTPLFSVNYLKGNFTTNMLFWTGAYTNVPFQFNGVSYTYHVEFPFSFTIFAIVGLALLLIRKRIRVATQLILWFFIVLVFYTSYYGGSALYNSGDDIRYFMISFPVIAILASTGFVSIYDIASKLLSGKAAVRKRKGRAAARDRFASYEKSLLLIVLFMLLFSNSVMQIVNIVVLPPSHIFTFAAERYDEKFIIASESLVPKDCMVVTFKPPLWYILGYPNVYTSWAGMPGYQTALQNISKGCLYFDRSISCYLTEVDEGGPNTTSECDNFTQSHILIPVNVTRFENDTWNVTLGIYKALPLNSST